MPWSKEQRKEYLKTPKGMDNKRRKHRARIKRNYEFINESKLASGCIDCGYSRHPAALDFDHITDDKKWSIGNMGARSLNALKLEMSKCVVRCANCHRIKTWEERGVKHRYELPDYGK